VGLLDKWEIKGRVGLMERKEIPAKMAKMGLQEILETREILLLLLNRLSQQQKFAHLPMKVSLIMILTQKSYISVMGSLGNVYRQRVAIWNARIRKTTQ
jgi:hypothetical protein